jgi:hypothetical protein
MMTIAGGIILAVVLLWLGGIVLVLILGVLSKACNAWSSATLKRQIAAARTAKNYPVFTYTTNTGGFDAT